MNETERAFDVLYKATSTLSANRDVHMQVLKALEIIKALVDKAKESTGANSE